MIHAKTAPISHLCVVHWNEVSLDHPRMWLFQPVETCSCKVDLLKRCYAMEPFPWVVWGWQCMFIVQWWSRGRKYLKHLCSNKIKNIWSCSVLVSCYQTVEGFYHEHYLTSHGTDSDWYYVPKWGHTYQGQAKVIYLLKCSGWTCNAGPRLNSPWIEQFKNY